jgi:hypothetical protein
MSIAPDGENLDSEQTQFMGKQRNVTLWLVLLLLVVLHVGGIIACVTWIWFPTGDPLSPYRSIHLEPNGSFTLRGHGPEGETLRVRDMGHVSDLFAEPIRWPVATGAGLVLLMLVVSMTGARRQLSSPRFKWPRFTMSRVMVVIAAIAIWLWLSRTAMFWILCGSLVLLLALVADIRRSRLEQEIKTEGAAPTVWIRLGIAGYWVAVILALSWIVCVLVGDALWPTSAMLR